MFERLAQQVLGKFLSKYFTEESLTQNKLYTSKQLGVWSGYVSLENLELKKEYVNAKLRSKALPFEIVHCSLRRVEITIPWAKLSNPMSSNDRRGKEDAVVVVVVDGIHILVRTSLDFDDVALRQEEIKKRRQALADPFRRVDADSESKSYKELLKKRLRDGLLQEMMSKLHIHLRDVHIRMEDVESHPANPYACGITLESMHIQHDDETEATDGVVSKMAQLNHLAVYWNPIGYGDGLPVENSALHQTCSHDPEKISRALNFCISRRASLIASPSRNPYIPTHSYLLLPVDGTWHGRLSTNPTDLSDKPAVQLHIAINPVFGQLRDFQCVQILRLASEYKNHKHVKQYRRFRPLVAVKDDPKAWWLYAARVIRYELRESFLRWSWGRFADVYRIRNRYMNLYERKMKFPIQEAILPVNSLDDFHETLLSGSTRSCENTNENHNGTTPDDGAGPCTQIIPDGGDNGPLTNDEILELQYLEDGLIGDIPIDTILLFRAMVNLRVPPRTSTPPQATWGRSFFWSAAVDNEFVQDSEAKMELETLLAYLDNSSSSKTISDISNADKDAISMVIVFEELTLSLLAPLFATTGESSVRQIHEKFLDLSIVGLKFGYTVKGDYEGKVISMSIQDLVGTEIRGDKSHHIIAKQVERGKDRREFENSKNTGREPFLVVRHATSAKNRSGCDVALVVCINAIELTLTPDCEWMSHIKSIMNIIKKVPNVADYWDSLSLAYLNSLALGRLGLVAKAESAIPEHKNIDADINVQCPTLRIGDGKGGHLIIDLGSASFKTERLAGVPRAQAVLSDGNHGGASNASIDASVPVVDDASAVGSVSTRTWSSKIKFETPSIVRKRSDRYSVFSSALSVESRTRGGHANRSTTGSVCFDDAVLGMNFVDDEMEDDRKQDATALNYLFYDVYSLHLQTGKVTFCGDNDAFDISGGFEVHTVLRKSVLPADHTLCKMKAHAVVKCLKIEMNRRVVLAMASAITTWKGLMRSNIKTNTFDVSRKFLGSSHKIIPEPSSFLDEALSDEASLSEIDENEFFDANETNGSFVGDGSAAWFEDNWISDAESFIDSDSRSARDERRRRRRRAGSVSDMSSVSDQSAKDSTKDASTKVKKAQHGNAYLSAENLARLEEGAGEDESLGESAIDLDEASFHSVMSEAGQRQVARDLEIDIDQARRKVEKLSSELKEVSRTTGRASQTEQEKLRQRRISIRLQLNRTKAELKGLRALHEDLGRLQVDSPSHLGSDGDEVMTLVSRRSVHAKSARALLSARKRRDFMLETNGDHNLTQDLNRELFQGSIIVQNCHVVLHLSDEIGGQATESSGSTFVFEACQTGLAIFHQVHDTKFYFSSDHVSAASKEKTDTSHRSRVLFSGGNSDAFLPSHFPHLVSRSMEEKFLRFSLHRGNYRANDAATRPRRTTKCRLVVGDVEVFPSRQLLAPLKRLVAAVGASRNVAGGPTEARNAPALGFEGTKDLITRVPEQSTGKPFYYDLAIRLSSTRLILANNNKIIGAAVVTEAAFRLVHAAAPAREKLQLDMRCINLQVVEISSLEAGHGSELFGRKDPYNALVQMRLRSQLVTEDNCAGWVVGGEAHDTDNYQRGYAPLVRNAHCGLKINPLTIVAAPEAMSSFLGSLHELKQLFSDQAKERTLRKGDVNKETLFHRLQKTYPLRWRFDGSMKRIVINFPEQQRSDWSFGDDIGSQMKMAFSIVCCLQESASHTGHIAIQMAVSEISLTRSSDDWPILEHFTVLGDASVETKSAGRYASKDWVLSKRVVPQLKLDAGSSISEIAAVLHRYGWDSVSLQHDQSIQYGLNLMTTPLKVNLSAPIIGLVSTVSRSLKRSLSKKREIPREKGPSRSLMERRIRIGFHVVMEELELEILREIETKPVAHAKSLISFTMADTRIDFEQGDQIAASILIRNSSLFDLSSSRGVQVVGENVGGHEKDNPYFVRVKLYIAKPNDGPTNSRLEINWGSIQCLVMPSFLVSILSLKSEIQSILRESKPATSGAEKGDILDTFVAFDHDVNLLLSAHADSFECILSSKDISEYVRQGGTESIGVVTLRWKASLSVSLALDTLKGSSVAWLTLNLDGKFTDDNDLGIFKDFVSRYLSLSSGLVAGSDELGQKVKNPFTALLGLYVSDFQVIRTTISGKLLKPPPKPVSYKSAHRMCFVVKPPFAGEQRVTNPIDLELIYKATGAAMVAVSETEEAASIPQVEISQLLQAKAKFVDVLLYISQSAGGFTESFKTTVKPVLDILKNDESSRRQRNDNKSNTSASSLASSRKTLKHLFKSAPTVVTIQLEGLQITCVPSGATRLNESPIIKVELKHFRSGLAAVPLALEGRRPPTNSSNLLGAVDLMHSTVAGWVACEITGHYHNRRLVAWEPFVEPWTAEVRFGIDATDLFGLVPVATNDHGEIKSSPTIGSAVENMSSSSLPISDGTGDRLRDFGRLFRAPFQSSLSTKQRTNDQSSISHADFCYLMLASTSRTTILSIMYPSNESDQEKETKLFSRLPKRENVEWLRGFGFPGRENNELYSATCVLSDSKPLNINITGALLENVLGYLHSLKSDELRQVAPHWIRNDTGMTVRFQEVLEPDRLRRGEEAGKVIVTNGSEVPLTLKRSLSQTCDPHCAYIHLEIGSFEDTVGRIRHDDFEIPKGALSSSFFFKAAAKISVDTVGVHRYPLDRNGETRSDGNGSPSDSRVLGWIIVRVALRDGIKVVSVESPFVLKSTADTDLICEVRDFNGLSLLWRCLVPKSDCPRRDTRNRENLVSVPADIVPFLHDGLYSFTVFALPRTLSVSHEAELTSFGGNKAIQVKTPPPFSPQSYGKGMIGEQEIALSTWHPDGDGDISADIHLTVSSFRIGSFSGVRASVEVPEQRMMVFRAPLAIRNCLALPIAIQVRVKQQGVIEKSQQNQGLTRLKTLLSDWEDLGILECGQSVNWTGAKSSEKVHLRVRFVGTDGDNSRRFPGWSSAIYVPVREEQSRVASRPRGHVPKAFARMKVLDAESVALNLSVAFDDDIYAGNAEYGTQSDIRTLSHSISAGTRAVSIFVPYWIVDSTNQDLEFFSGAAVAGQLGNESQIDDGNEINGEGCTSLGLAELLDNVNFLNLPSTRSFEVMMLGDESSTRLMVRKRLARQTRNLMRRYTPPWSDPIPLQAERASQYDVTVLAPKIEKDERGPESDDIRSFDQFVLRSKVFSAPDRFGGKFGTKLIHVVNRYNILNETGRDVEIASDGRLDSAVVVRGTRIPHPFHLDDTSPMRVRFKEFGWTWSGKFKIRLNRPEVTMRLRHRMKGQSVIVTVEVVANKGSTNMIIIRQSSHPPFRLENHTMFPLHFGQSATRIGSEETEIDAMLLPYQSTDFAWDEPELRRRTLVVRVADSPPSPQGCTLGRFQLDTIAPGTILALERGSFAGEIVADGPTRVMRITDSNMPSLSTSGHDLINDFQRHSQDKTRITLSLSVKLVHGIGISVVDWSPQELLYARFEDVHLERKFDGKFDNVSMSAGNIKLNNQLWVTPYPVLLKMGRRIDSLQPMRRKNRRHDAINISWKRSLNTHGGYGNVTLLERVEVSSEPIFVNVDGKVADLLFNMVRQVSRIWRREKNLSSSLSRDDELQKMLFISWSPSGQPDNARKGFSLYHQSSDGDLMTTAAVASKLKAEPLPFVTVNTSSPRMPRSLGGRKESQPEEGKAQHKYYIEKLRISATKADLSWSGPLPGLVSSLLLRALTFEKLPVRLRPYSISHAYGNAKDHLQSVKSHYLSIWRILDLLIGLSSNPTFLFRAIVYTSREVCASILDSWATDARRVAKSLSKLSGRGREKLPLLYEDGGSGGEVTKSFYFGWTIMSPFAKGGAAILYASSSCAYFVSSLLKYSAPGSKRLAARGLVRSRNPRLFAHMDGNDLLVEYVEGENAGKALLSRVRMGMHLGEGYIFHSEGARLLNGKSRSSIDLDPSPLIVMVTSERTLLLNGKLDWDFCSVVWEATFANIVHLELVMGNEMSVTHSHDEVVIWYLSDTTFAENTSDDKAIIYAKALVAGIDVLRSMSVFVPHGTGVELATKMSRMDGRLGQNFESLIGSKIKQD